MHDVAALDPLAMAGRFRHHRMILGSAYHFVFVMGDDTRITDVCDGITQHLDYARDEIVGRSILDFVHPADHERATAAMLRELFEPNSLAASLVVQVKHKNGTWRHVETAGFFRPDDPEIRGMLIGCRDVSGLGLGDRVLAANDFVFRSLATSASDGTTIFDATGKRVYTSPSLARMLGYSSDDMTRFAASTLVTPDHLPLWRTATREALESPEGFARIECQLKHRDGHSLWIEATVINLLQDPSVRGVVAHVRNIDERRRVELELRHQAQTDGLTGLGNRAAFMDALRNAADQHRAVLFCDLDGFKSVNDTHGHDEGDALLCRVAGAIRRVIRAGDSAARIGGDEFCLLLPETDEQVVRHRAEELRLAVLQETVRQGVGISIGIAFGVPGEPVTEVLSRSDQAMYRAKRIGRSAIEADTPPHLR
jgi:diguanylate cyclase (GGDEF)-like protein/PAS domain S-box-containing protein